MLTGAGWAPTGIPDYRDAAGEWKRRLDHVPGVRREQTRTQALLGEEPRGFRRMRSARPNDAHTSLAALERRGRIVQLVTQNVDGLREAAGSQHVMICTDASIPCVA